jgi:hypothetical protein
MIGTPSSQCLVAYHGTAPGAPLIGGPCPVSRRKLDVLWTSNSYFLAAQFQDGEVRKLALRLTNPLIIDEDCRALDWDNRSHAYIVACVAERIAAGTLSHDAVIFTDTVDGMEVGDVIAIFPRKNICGQIGIDHAVRQLGVRYYDQVVDEWVSGPGF